VLCQTSGMSDNPAAHFGRQVKKERLARSWTLPQLEEVTGIDNGHWSRIENGKRPPTEKIALAADKAFRERTGWFYEYWSELQTWSEVPSYFKPRAEYELSTTTLRAWSPVTLDGLLQTEDYASATPPTATAGRWRSARRRGRTSPLPCGNPPAPRGPGRVPGGDRARCS